MSRVGEATKAFYDTLLRREQQDLQRGVKLDTGGKAVQATTDLSLLANSQSQSSFGTGPIPKEVQEAMAAQGMTTGGPWSPGRPIQQFSPWDLAPRVFDVQTGYNVGTRPRSQGGRASFYTLKSILESWDVARMCIEHLEDDIRSFDWEILPAKGIEEDVTDQCRQGRSFLEKPNGYTPFDSWLNMYLEDLLRFDAATLFRQRTRAGKIGSVEVLSGQMIAPLVDYFGATPKDPAPAYVQYANGMPWVWLTQKDLIYQPYRMLPESLYGYPPIEWLLLTANTDIRFQWHFLQYFTEGTIPDTFMEAPPDASDPEELKKFQDTWDAVMEGDQAMKHKVRWVPSGAKPVKAGDKNFDEKFPLYLMRKTCAAFKIVPADIGITDSVNKASSETQVDVQFRIGTKPRLDFLQGILTRILQEDLGLPCRFNFDTGREKQDRLQEAQAHDVYVKMGAESPDEVRRDVLNLPVNNEAMTPRFIFSGRVGAIPLKSIAEIAGKIDPLTISYEPGDVDLDAVNKLRTQISPTGVVPNADDLSTQKQKIAATGTPNSVAGLAGPPPKAPASAAVTPAPKEAAATGVGASAKRSEADPDELKRMVEGILAPELARLEAAKDMLQQAREQLRDKRLVQAMSRSQRPVSVHMDEGAFQHKTELHVDQPAQEVHAHVNVGEGAIQHTSKNYVDARTSVERGAVEVEVKPADVKAPDVKISATIQSPKPAKRTTVRKGKDGSLIVDKEE